MTTIVAKTRATDGKLVRVYPDGREKVLKPPPMRKMTEKEIEAAALSDPDNPPLTKAELAKMRRVSPVKRLRWRLSLSQEAFAARYKIPLGTLRDWEQGRSEPDAPARAYLTVIAQDPDRTAKAFKKMPVAAE
jgi:putative transcriptional regulator